jgi:hypothetical protein
MKFGACRSQLYDGQKTTRAHWEQITAVWNDDARRSFEEAVWEPLDRQVSEVLAAMDQLSSLFTQIRSECEHDTI